MSYEESEYLLLSGIQHFIFCKRQWALIHIEKQWAENLLTVDGNIMHKNAHNPSLNEVRKDTVTVRAMPISSSRLGLSGECDVVEFKKNKDGISLLERDGKFTVTPIEYKRGTPKKDECDIMQLTAQTLCLEDMLCCEIPYGYLFYGETKHRLKVEFTQDLRSRTENTVFEMHKLYSRRHTPKVKRTKACNACSLKNICLPILCKNTNVSNYISTVLEYKP